MVDEPCYVLELSLTRKKVASQHFFSSPSAQYDPFFMMRFTMQILFYFFSLLHTTPVGIFQPQNILSVTLGSACTYVIFVRLVQIDFANINRHNSGGERDALKLCHFFMHGIKSSLFIVSAGSICV